MTSLQRRPEIVDVEIAKMPGNRQAERATLGAALMAPHEVMPYLAKVLPDAAAFQESRHHVIYSAMLALHNKRTPPDIVTLGDELRRTGNGKLAGYLIELGAECPTAYSVPHYAAIVSRTAVLRKMIEAGAKIASLGYSEPEDLEGALAQAHAELNLCNGATKAEGVFTMPQALESIYPMFDPNGEDDAGLQTGLYDLDELLEVGLLPGDMYLIAGRPGLGKTSLALCIGLHVALVQRRPVTFVSLEMPKEQLILRCISILTGISFTYLLKNRRRLSGNELIKVMEAMGKIEGAPFTVVDAGRMPIEVVRQKAHQAQAEHLESLGRGTELLIVDYIQIAQAPAKMIGNEVAAISYASGELHNLAKELKCPAIVLSQLSRALESRGAEAKRPELPDLRGSGALEQDATGVIFVYRESKYDKEADPDKAELIVAKHRHGPEGDCAVAWHGPSMRFHSGKPSYSIEGY